MTIQNPILPGFHPDPSIVRVGEDYYIAVSTFQWFPGVQIYHSRDLANWQLVARPLERTSQLDMRGNVDSGGVWAPCLSYCDGTYYLVYTDVKQWEGDCRDWHNYLVTAPDIRGPWSEPVYLNSSGFDPSLFHDDDGKKYLVNMLWDFRPAGHRQRFAGIVLQEYDPVQQRLAGEIKNIFPGTLLGFTEGPHLYKRDGYYYLLTAEGGTFYDHAVTLARAAALDGPYQGHPHNPVLTAKGDKTLALQKAGHADLVDTPDGDWYLVHLCARPLPGTDRCTLGRETAIQPVYWAQDGWLYLTGGGNRPQEQVPAPHLPVHPFPPLPETDHFDAPVLGMQYQSLRIPVDDSWLSLSARPGWLRLYGRESLHSCFCQSLIARRQQSFCVSVSTAVAFAPADFSQMAGLVCYYDTRNFHYLCVTHDETLGKCDTVYCCTGGRTAAPASSVCVEGWPVCHLRADICWGKLQWSLSPDGQDWQPVGGMLDASNLSDDFAGGFTGTFLGLCCQDLSGRSAYAEFDYFTCTEN